jgi:integrase
MPKNLTYPFASKQNKPGRYFDTVTGLHLLIKSTGRRYWIFRFKLGEKRSDLSLGVFPEVSIAEAREAANEARKLLRAGINPKARRKEEAVETAIPHEASEKISFQEFATSWLVTKRPEWRNPKHADQWQNTLTQYAFPVIGDLAIDEVQTEDVLAVLEPIWRGKTVTASRLRGRIERILAAATARKLREGMNPALWRGHLDSILPMPKKTARVKHHEALPFRELPQFIEKIRARTGVAPLALEFLILNASRTGEVIGAKREEVKEGIWTVPAVRMKTGKEHRIPLSPRALKLIEMGKELDPRSPYIFSIKGSALSNMAMLNLVHRLNPKLTVHGFRSTFRDWVSEATEFSPELAEMALAHRIANQVEAAYRRGDLLHKRQQLMLAWEAHCSNGINPIGC